MNAKLRWEIPCPHRSASRAPFIAGEAGFSIFNQCRDGSDRQDAESRFDAMPPSPIAHACPKDQGASSSVCVLRTIPRRRLPTSSISFRLRSERGSGRESTHDDGWEDEDDDDDAPQAPEPVKALGGVDYYPPQLSDEEFEQEQTTREAEHPVDIGSATTSPAIRSLSSSARETSRYRLGFRGAADRAAPYSSSRAWLAGSSESLRHNLRTGL
jgi:hypothetical protein